MYNAYTINGILAGVLSMLGFIPYIISILRGKTQPNKATWFIWAIVGGLLAFSYMAESDKSSIWLPFSYFVGPFIIAILALRYGYIKWSKLDTFCIIAALISIIPWILSDNATLTLLINTIIDGAGALPTLVKTYYESETEDLTAWSIFFAANVIQLFAIETWNIASLYPIYLVLLAANITLFILRDKIKNKLLPIIK